MKLLIGTFDIIWQWTALHRSARVICERIKCHFNLSATVCARLGHIECRVLCKSSQSNEKNNVFSCKLDSIAPESTIRNQWWDQEGLNMGLFWVLPETMSMRRPATAWNMNGSTWNTQYGRPSTKWANQFAGCAKSGGGSVCTGSGDLRNCSSQNKPKITFSVGMHNDIDIISVNFICSLFLSDFTGYLKSVFDQFGLYTFIEMGAWSWLTGDCIASSQSWLYTAHNWVPFAMSNWIPVRTHVQSHSEPTFNPWDPTCWLGLIGMLEKHI